MQADTTAITDTQLAQLVDLAKAASPGPWCWGGSAKMRSLSLFSRGYNLVFDAARCGRNAVLEFNIKGIMHNLHDRCEVDHNSRPVKTNCPDADYIAAADPSTVLALATELQAARAERDAPLRPDSNCSACGGHGSRCDTCGAGWRDTVASLLTKLLAAPQVATLLTKRPDELQADVIDLQAKLTAAEARLAELQAVVDGDAERISQMFFDRAEAQSGGFTMQAHVKDSWLIKSICYHLLTCMDDAPNYTETELELLPQGGEPCGFVLTIRRMNGKTPHQLRIEALTRAEQAEARLAAVLAERDAYRNHIYEQELCNLTDPSWPGHMDDYDAAEQAEQECELVLENAGLAAAKAAAAPQGEGNGL